jgi:hypothetical protein
MKQLSYVLHPSGNYHVTLICLPSKTISVCPGFFRKHAGVHPSAIVGCLPASDNLLLQLGFNIAEILEVV